MNYTKAQLEALPDLTGSTSQMKLKISESTKRVWLFVHSKFGVVKNEVVIEELQSGTWNTTKRYNV